MGAGCSATSGKTAEHQESGDCPSRPAYLAGDLVGPPVIECVRIGPVDTLLAQAAQFAEAVCQLNDSLNGLLLDVRLATGLLQGGFSLLLTPSPNVDIFSFELLTADGQAVEVAAAARLRGRDLTHGGRLASLDSQLTQCLEDLADSFARNVGVAATALSLSPSGTLVPRVAGQPSDPVVDAFNRTMMEMRTALGADFLLALHLHKAQAHGLPAFRAKLLKPLPEQQQLQQEHEGQQQQQHQRRQQALGAGPAAGPAPAGGWSGAAAASPSGFVPATLLDQAACLNASKLADALHAFQDANGRLAEALKKTGLTCPHAVVPVTARSVGLAAVPRTTTTTTTTVASPNSSSAAVRQSTRHQHHHHHRGGTLRRDADPAAVGAAAVRSLSDPARRLVARAVEGLNGAVHRLAHAAAAAPGPASFAALLTHVLGELRDVVAAAGGERALDSYQPTVHFAGGPDTAPSLDFQLDPQLAGLPLRGPGEPANPTGGAGTRLPAFPDCLSPQVRRAWLLLQELLRVHNSAVTQLESLRQLAGAFEEGLRRRITSISDDAAAARMSVAGAAEATRALLRNHVELRDCWQGALHALSSTALLVRDEMAEAAQLARVQCSFMSPLAWSVSIASSALATASPGGGLGSVSSSLALSTGGMSGLCSTASAPNAMTSTASGSLSTPHASGVHATATSLTAAASSSSSAAAAVTSAAASPGAALNGPVWSAPPRLLDGVGFAGGASVRSRGGSAAKSLADRFAAAATDAGDPRPPPPPLQLGSSPDVASVHGPLMTALSQPAETAPLLSQPEGRSSTADGAGAGAGTPPSRVVGPASRTALASGAAGAGTRSMHRSGATSLRSSETRESGGWVPVEPSGGGVSTRADGGEERGSRGAAGAQGLPDGAATAAATGGPRSTGQSPARAGGRPAGASPAAAAAANRGRTGGDSLADEYARAALAHLRLQDL